MLIVACTGSSQYIDVAVGNQSSVVVMSVFGWIIVMQRMGWHDWNKSWAVYKAGFGNAKGTEFWFGLERLHLLTTSASYRLLIEVQLVSDGRWYMAQYDSIVIGDEINDRYRLNVDVARFVNHFWAHVYLGFQASANS